MYFAHVFAATTFTFGLLLWDIHEYHEHGFFFILGQRSFQGILAVF